MNRLSEAGPSALVSILPLGTAAKLAPISPPCTECELRNVFILSPILNQTHFFEQLGSRIGVGGKKRYEIATILEEKETKDIP